MKKNKLLTALALASAAFAVSAQNIATVNGKPIPKSLQDEWVAQLVANGGKDTPEARRQITENLVANALVEQEAAKRKISDDPKVKFALDYAKFRILQEALLVAGVASAVLGNLADKTSIEYVYNICAYMPLLGLVTFSLPNLKKQKI